MSTYGTLVVLLKPFFDAVFVEEVTTRHLSRLVFQVLAANSTSWKFKGSSLLILFAVRLRNLDFWQVFDCFLRSRRSATSASVLHGKSENLLKEVVVKGRPEVHLSRVGKEEHWHSR